MHLLYIPKNQNENMELIPTHEKNTKQAKRKMIKTYKQAWTEKEIYFKRQRKGCSESLVIGKKYTK